MRSSQTNPQPPYLERLFGRINYERQVPASAKNFDLSKMRGLMQRLGNPENSASVIHVAGTKGKGSVCVMLGASLSSAGMKTGVYTSPHLETIHQRMAIDGQLITDDQMAASFQRIDAVIQEFDKTLVAKGKQPISFFEYTTALAFDFFAAENCDVVVLETGLGGRLDSTNVCQPDVCVITNISRDHTRILGDTLEEIAGEKAGIIKQGVPVISGVTNSPSREVIAAVAKQRGSDLHLRNETFEIVEGGDTFSFRMKVDATQAPIADLQLKMRGSHQRANASLAIAAMMLLREKGWAISDEAIRAGLAIASLPGRIEILGSGPTVLMDMAHNPASVKALAEMLQEDLPAYTSASQRVLVFGTTRDKDCQKMLEQIVPLFDRVIFTKYKNNPRGLSVAKLVKLAEPIVAACKAKEKERTIKVETDEDPVGAWNSSIAQPHEENFVCVAGSAFLIAEVRPTVLEFFDGN